MRCEPLGLARLITFSGGGANMEMVQTKDRIVELFEWTWEFAISGWTGASTESRRLPTALQWIFGWQVGGRHARRHLGRVRRPPMARPVRLSYQRPGRTRGALGPPEPESAPRTAQAHGSRELHGAVGEQHQVWALIPKEAMAIGGWSGCSKTAACRATNRCSTNSAIARPGSARRSPTRRSNPPRSFRCAPQQVIRSTRGRTPQPELRRGRRR